MPYKDKEKQKECNRICGQKDRNFRYSLLGQFSCICCHETDSDLIDWHHVDPSKKSFGIKAGAVKPHSVWWNEVLKCVPLCALCHRKLHKDKLCLLPVHL